MAGGGKGGAPAPPPPPDPTKLAQAQGTANIDTARVQGAMNRVNQVTPYGSITYAPNEAQRDNWLNTKLDEDRREAERQGRTWDRDKAWEYFNTRNPYTDSYTVKTELSPDQQRLLDMTEQGQQIYGQAAVNQMGKVQDLLSSPFQGEPFANRTATAGAIADRTMGAIAARDIDGFRDPTAGQRSAAGDLSASAAQRANALAGQPINTDYNAIRQQAMDAANSRMNPQFQQDEEALRSRLLASGHAEGSAGWNNAYRQFNNSRNDMRMQSVLNAENLAGQAIQQTGALRGIPLGELGQVQGMAGNLANTAGSLQGQAINQYRMPYQQAQDLIGLAGQNANLANLGYQQAMSTRNQPLNETAALLSGNMIQTPQAQAVPQVQVAPTDVIGPTMGGYAGQMQAYNTQQQQAAANMGGLYGLGSSAIMAAGLLRSDRRLKEDIRKVGKTDEGHNVYTYRYRGEPATHMGVMAQEIRKSQPDAVKKLGGFYAVDYAKVA